MPSTIPTVTVGIPAYNEEANIAHLLEDLLCQQEDGFRLEKILVVSDGSSDRTVELVNAIGDKRIEVRDDGLRKGVAERQNEILKSNTSDALVLLNADLSLPSRRFLTEMVSPIFSETADLVAAKIDAYSPKTMTERALHASLRLKRTLFESWKNGRNIYTCAGAARAFSRRFANVLRFTDGVGEDAYSYLYCRAKGFRYAYARNAEVFIKLPDNFEDHAKQSIRFRQSKERFIETFGKKAVAKEYALPMATIIVRLCSRILIDGLSLILFILITLRVKWRALFSQKISQFWDTAASSKRFIGISQHKKA